METAKATNQPTQQNLIFRLLFISMCTSSVLWVTYGLLKQEPKILLANGSGLVLGLYYFVQFLRHAPPQSATLPGSKKQHIQIFFVAVGMSFLLAVSRTPLAVELLGQGGVVLTVTLFASPLAALRTVISTKSARSIPWPFTLASLVNCILWTIAGLFEMKDFNIYAPNILGLFFCLAQVALKVTYGDGPANKVELPM